MEKYKTGQELTSLKDVVLNGKTAFIKGQKATILEIDGQKNKQEYPLKELLIKNNEWGYVINESTMSRLDSQFVMKNNK